jgi:hypothetical protein
MVTKLVSLGPVGYPPLHFLRASAAQPPATTK